jgi:hypothetical protein
MKNKKKMIAILFLKGGQIAATFFVFLSFIHILLYGQYVWVEPSIIILIGEIVWFSYTFIGTLVEAIQWASNRKTREG